MVYNHRYDGYRTQAVDIRSVTEIPVFRRNRVLSGIRKVFGCKNVCHPSDATSDLDLVEWRDSHRATFMSMATRRGREIQVSVVEGRLLLRSDRLKAVVDLE